MSKPPDLEEAIKDMTTEFAQMIVDMRKEADGNRFTEARIEIDESIVLLHAVVSGVQAQDVRNRVKELEAKQKPSRLRRLLKWNES